MSGYIIEEPEECPVFMDVDNNSEVEQYWLLYSKYQRKRHGQVMRQFDRIWYEVLKSIQLTREYSSLEHSNHLMKNIYKLFLSEHKLQVEYYLEENIKIRKQNNYLQKKIKKIKNKKYRI